MIKKTMNELYHETKRDQLLLILINHLSLISNTLIIIYPLQWSNSSDHFNIIIGCMQTQDMLTS